MLFRFIIVLACIVVFINGCNSLVSQYFGTHKLRTFTMEDAVKKGVGDSDYLELQKAWASGDYVFVPGKRKTDPSTLLYPLLTQAQLEQVEQGQQVQPHFIAWTQNFPTDCPSRDDCSPRRVADFKGVVRKPGKEFNGAKNLAANKYQLPSQVVYLEVNRAPIAWYWNLSMMVGAVLVAFLLEMRNFRKNKMQPPAEEGQ